MDSESPKTTERLFQRPGRPLRDPIFLTSQLSSPAERVALRQPREIYIKQVISLLQRKVVLADFAAREKPSHHEFCGFGGVSTILRE